jgi:hypothetical protein
MNFGQKQIDFFFGIFLEKYFFQKTGEITTEEQINLVSPEAIHTSLIPVPGWYTKYSIPVPNWYVKRDMYQYNTGTLRSLKLWEECVVLKSITLIHNNPGGIQCDSMGTKEEEEEEEEAAAAAAAAAEVKPKKSFS